MTKFFLAIIFTCFGGIAIAQKGLEKIIVEKYYISDTDDSLNSIPGGILPVGSVTYRIYADMLPGYRFQAAFGIPGHELRIETTTKFFNNADKGSVVANAIPDRNLKDNTVMLDSWLSVGAASEGNMGILKEEDDTINTIAHEKHYLQNDNKAAGIPVKVKDGLISRTASFVTGIGVDTAIKVFDNLSNGSLFSTWNGSWACMGGAIGPDSLSNKVLIAQITTEGVFSFELNVQIGTPSGGYERYVAKNPAGDEIQISSLIYNSRTASKEFKSIKKNKKRVNN